MANNSLKKMGKEYLKERKALVVERNIWAVVFALTLVAIVYMGHQF